MTDETPKDFHTQLLQVAHFLIWRAHREAMHGRRHEGDKLANPRSFADPIFGDLNTYLRLSAFFLGRRAPDWIKTFRSSAKYFAPGVRGTNMLVEFLRAAAKQEVVEFGKAIFSTFDDAEATQAAGDPPQPDERVANLLTAAGEILEHGLSSRSLVVDELDRRFIALLHAWLHPPQDEARPSQSHHHIKSLMTPLEYRLSLCEPQYLHRGQVRLDTATRRTLISRRPMAALRRSGATLARSDAKRGTINLGILAEVIDHQFFRLASAPKFEPTTSLKLDAATLYFHGPSQQPNEDPDDSAVHYDRPVIEVTPSKAVLQQMNQHVTVGHEDLETILAGLFQDRVLREPMVAYWLEAYGEKSLGAGETLTPIRVLYHAQDEKIVWMHVLLMAWG